MTNRPKTYAYAFKQQTASEAVHGLIALYELDIAAYSERFPLSLRAAHHVRVLAHMERRLQSLRLARALIDGDESGLEDITENAFRRGQLSTLPD